MTNFGIIGSFAGVLFLDQIHGNVLTVCYQTSTYEDKDPYRPPHVRSMIE